MFALFTFISSLQTEAGWFFQGGCQERRRQIELEGKSNNVNQVNTASNKSRASRFQETSKNKTLSQPEYLLPWLSRRSERLLVFDESAITKRATKTSQLEIETGSIKTGRWPQIGYRCSSATRSGHLAVADAIDLCTCFLRSTSLFVAKDSGIKASSFNLCCRKKN